MHLVSWLKRINYFFMEASIYQRTVSKLIAYSKCCKNELWYQETMFMEAERNFLDVKQATKYYNILRYYHAGLLPSSSLWFASIIREFQETAITQNNEVMKKSLSLKQFKGDFSELKPRSSPE